MDLFVVSNFFTTLKQYDLTLYSQSIKICKHWTIKRWDDRSVDPSSHCIILQNVGNLVSATMFQIRLHKQNGKNVLLDTYTIKIQISTYLLKCLQNSESRFCLVIFSKFLLGVPRLRLGTYYFILIKIYESDCQASFFAVLANFDQLIDSRTYV